MLGRLLGENIALEIQYRENAADRHADPVMIEMVVLNLAVNARDAMPQGGTACGSGVDRDIESRRTPQPFRARPGQIRLHPRYRYRLRHRAGSVAAHFRAVFHHQGSRQRHRPRPGDRVRHRQTTSRLDRSRKRIRPAAHLPRVLCPPEPPGRRFPQPNRPSRGGAQGNDFAGRRRTVDAPWRGRFSNVTVTPSTKPPPPRSVGRVEETRAGNRLAADRHDHAGRTFGRDLAEALLAKKSELKIIYTSGYSPEITNGKDEITGTRQLSAQTLSPAEIAATHPLQISIRRRWPLDRRQMPTSAAPSTPAESPS